jgi:hypothetical protein
MMKHMLDLSLNPVYELVNRSMMLRLLSFGECRIATIQVRSMK